MTTIQVRCLWSGIAASAHVRIKDVFVIPEGAPGAIAELERRKFTAEEGVRIDAIRPI